MATYTIDQTDGPSFAVMREGRRVIGTGGRDLAEQLLAEYRDQELEARDALATGDPRAICELGWHRGGVSEPVDTHLGSSRLYFYYVTKIGEAGG